MTNTIQARRLVRRELIRAREESWPRAGRLSLNSLAPGVCPDITESRVQIMLFNGSVAYVASASG